MRSLSSSIVILLGCRKQLQDQWKRESCACDDTDNDPDHFHATVSHAPPEMQEASDRDEERKLKAEEGMEEILAERRSRNAHRAGNTPKKFLADRFRDYLVADIERQEENRPKKMTEEQLEEKKRKKTTHTKELINAKRRKTGYNIRSRRKAEPYKSGEWKCPMCEGHGSHYAGKECPDCKGTGKVYKEPVVKAEEGIGGMNMGSQRGLGHEAGYKQDPGQTAQITEVKEEKEKSAYENHEQDESPENEPNKQQIPPSKPGMDTFKSLYKKALIIKYNNIYKPANI